jgi:glycosyltransferase involved in cell wall biosynthesis
VAGSPFARLALAARLLRAEGLRSLLDRFRDRRLDERRACRFELVSDSARQGPPAETLWILPFPLQRRRGGAAIQLLVRLEARAASEAVAVLQRLPGRLRCELWGAGVSRPLAREWPLPASAEALPPLLDDALLPNLLAAARWVGARQVHFESLVDLPLTLPLAVAAHGFGIGLSAHDFALFCPRPHLLEEPAGRFCEFSTDPARCARCLSGSWSLPAGFQEERRAVAARLATAASRLEFPSDYMRREHLRLFPAIDPARTFVLPPESLAEPLPAPPQRTPAPLRRRPKRIAFAGAVHRHKGAIVFEEIVRRLAELEPGTFEWHVFGGGDPQLLRRLRRLPRTRVHGYYRAGALPSRLRAAGIDLAILPSIWPEAHCLVLDECAAAGIPVLAFDLGALGERIRAGGLGEVVDPGAGAAGLAAHLAALG